MRLSPFRLVLLPLALLLMAGCGAKSASSGSTPIPPTSAAAPTAGPQSTRAVPPTPVITGGSVAAIVNGHKIPMSLYRALVIYGQRQYAGQPGATTKAIAQQAMNQVIDNEVIREYAVAHHVDVPASAVDAQVTSTEQQAGGAAKFQSELTQAGLTMPIFRSLLQSNLRAQKLAGILFPLKSTPEPAVHVRHILISLQPQGKPARTNAQAKVLAEKILGQVQHGGNFAALAKQYSDDPGSASKGGDLGNVFRGETVPPFEHAAFTLKVDQPAIIQTQFGYHIIEVLGHTMAPPPVQTQQRAQQQKFTTWVHQQVGKAHIQRIAKVQ